MSLIVTGTVGIDTIFAPTGHVEAVLGGSCTYFAAAASFANEICAALDGALLAAAASVSGALERPAPDDYRFPSCEEERSFKELLETGHFRGLRPDQVEAVRSIASHVVV